MRIRQLDHGDMEALVEFIVDAYNDYPLATWFEKEPSKEDLEAIFYNKMRSIGSRSLIDVVAEDNGTIAGECEIARIDHDRGIIGILVRHGYRNRNLGSAMLSKAMSSAVDIGMTKFTAEVAEENKDAMKFFLSNGFSPIGYRSIEKDKKPQNIVLLQKFIS